MPPSTSVGCSSGETAALSIPGVVECRKCLPAIDERLDAHGPSVLECPQIDERDLLHLTLARRTSQGHAANQDMARVQLEQLFYSERAFLPLLRSLEQQLANCVLSLSWRPDSGAGNEFCIRGQQIEKALDRALGCIRASAIEC